jgi:hypothetical protein
MGMFGRWESRLAVKANRMLWRLGLEPSPNRDIILGVKLGLASSFVRNP